MIYKTIFLTTKIICLNIIEAELNYKCSKVVVAPYFFKTSEYEMDRRGPRLGITNDPFHILPLDRLIMYTSRYTKIITITIQL